MNEQEAPAPRRICVVGDELVAGLGDPKALGWVGRVAARTPWDSLLPSGVYPLGVPSEGTAELLERWPVECDRRWRPGHDNRLVLGLGAHDLRVGLSLARSRLNLANVVDEASARGLPTFVVGPPPSLDGALNEDLGELSEAFADVCHRRGVTYVDCFGPLSTHEQWYADLSSGDGRHPQQAGYGLLAWLVLHGGWYEWLGLPRP